MRIVVIADDLSGAAELGAAALRFGLSAEVQTDFDPATSADVCLVDTDSRWCPTAEAVRRVAQVARRLIACPQVWIYKKVDSLLRGPVLDETQALARTLGRERAVLIPANPSRGRLIRGGHYFVNDVPLDECPLASDPEYPRRSSLVRELLAVGRVGTVPESLADGLALTSLVVPDIETTADLMRWCDDIGPETLPAGAVDFFTALVAHQLGRAPATDELGFESPRTANFRRLTVCGSAAAWPSRQAAAESATPPAPYTTAPPEVFAAERRDDLLDAWAREIAQQLQHHGDLLVGLGATPAALADRPTAPATALVRRLATAVTQALSITTPSELRLEGGATAAAIVRQLGWNRLAVCGAQGPGVAVLRPIGADPESSPTLLVKPGSYEWL